MGHAIVLFYVDFALAVAASWGFSKLAGFVRGVGRSDDDDDSDDGRGGWNWKPIDRPHRPGPERGRGSTAPSRRPVDRRPRIRR